MAKRQTQTPEKMEGGGADRIKVPGWYHVHVQECLADVTPKGKPITGIYADFAAFEGQPEAGKTISSTFFDPDPLKAFDPNSGVEHADWKESQDGKGWLMSQKKQLSFLVAVGLINESQFGKALEYDTDDAKDRQLVVEIVVDERNADKGYMQINYANTYHVDDPRVADLVKAKKLALNQAAIKLLPDTMRRKPESFDLEKLGGRKQAASGNGNGSGSHADAKQNARQQAKELAGVGAGSSGVDLDNI